MSVTEFATWSPIGTYVVVTKTYIPITSQGCNRLFTNSSAAAAN